MQVKNLKGASHEVYVAWKGHFHEKYAYLLSIKLDLNSATCVYTLILKNNLNLCSPCKMGFDYLGKRTTDN